MQNKKFTELYPSLKKALNDFIAYHKKWVDSEEDTELLKDMSITKLWEKYFNDNYDDNRKFSDYRAILSNIYKKMLSNYNTNRNRRTERNDIYYEDIVHRLGYYDSKIIDEEEHPLIKMNELHNFLKDVEDEKKGCFITYFTEKISYRTMTNLLGVSQASIRSNIFETIKYLEIKLYGNEKSKLQFSKNFDSLTDEDLIEESELVKNLANLKKCLKQ